MHTSELNIIVTLSSEQPLTLSEQIVLVNGFCKIKNAQQPELNGVKLNFRLSEVEPFFLEE